MRSWMKNINGGFPLTEINIPGTHNSCACCVQFSLLSRCQNMSITQQLNSGIRFLDIRVQKDKDRLKLVHSIADCKNPVTKSTLYLDEVIDDCRAFLEENPSETILFCFKRDDGTDDTETFDTFFENYLEDEIWYKENRFPCLNDVRGKIVLLNRCCTDIDKDIYNDFNCGINLTGWPYQEKFEGKIFSEAPLIKYSGKATDYFLVQDMYRLSPKEKWNSAINPFLNNPPQTSGGVISFFSSTTGIFTPKLCATYINRKLSSKALKKAKKYGWIILDYPTEKFIKEIINSNF